jgi:hypothetical protein
MGMPAVLQGQQGQPPATGPPGGGHITMPPAAAPQAPAAQQGGAQIAVHLTGSNRGGVPQAMTGRGAQVAHRCNASVLRAFLHGMCNFRFQQVEVLVLCLERHCS